MEQEKRICGNCMSCCIHHKTKEVYRTEEEKDENGRVWMRSSFFDHYENFCDTNPDQYKAWHERNKEKTYPEYSIDYCPCYEPQEHYKRLNNLIDMSEKILDNLNKKEENK